MNSYILILMFISFNDAGGMDHIEGLTLEDCQRIGEAWKDGGRNYKDYQCIPRYENETKSKPSSAIVPPRPAKSVRF
jgi:hypothetical protein